MGLCDGCPPFGGAICGITDTFNPNQFNARPEGADVGIADCGRTWDFNAGNPITIASNSMRVPTYLVGVTSANLPGTYPVPFNGRIVAIGGDIHAGFTYVTTPDTPERFGAGTWDPSPPGGGDAHGFVDGAEAIIGRKSDLSPIVLPQVLQPRDDRLFFNVENAVTVTGHLRVTETHAGGPPFDTELDNYVRVDLGLGVSVVESPFILGGGGDPTAALLYVENVGHTPVYAFFPPFFWRDVGQADYSIEYTGRGGQIIATVGGVTATLDLDAGAGVPRGTVVIKNLSFDLGGGNAAEIGISDLVIGGKAVTDLNWEWKLEGTLVDLGGITFRFGYVSMGGAIPFPISPILEFREPDEWPYWASPPAIWAYVGGQLTVVPLGGDLGLPFTPVVTINGTTAILTISGVSASVSTPAAVWTLDAAGGGLTQWVRNGQGEYLLFNDLDVVGVNLCTETGITPGGGPGTNQPVFDEYVALGDGATTAYTTNAPYIAGTLQVQVAGMLVDIDSTHPASGAFTLVDPPPAGAEIRASYTVAATPPPAGDRPFAPPVTTATYNVPPAYVTFAEVNDWIDTVVPDGSRIEFPPAGSYSGPEGIQLGNRSHLDIWGNASTFQLTGAAGDHLSSGFIIGYSYSLGSFTGNSHHIALRGFIIEGNDPTPGTFGGGENQQAIRANGSSHIEVHDVTVRAVYGDGVFLDNCFDVWIPDIHVETAGRNGLTVVQGGRVLCESSLFDEVGYVTFDLEPNFSTEASDHITFRNNIIGTWDLDFVSIDGGFRGAPISNVFITGNVTTGKALHCAIDNGDGVNGNVGARMTNIVFSGNSSAVPAAGPRLIFAHIDGLTILGNDQPLTSGVLTDITDCTGITGP